MGQLLFAIIKTITDFMASFGRVLVRKKKIVGGLIFILIMLLVATTRFNKHTTNKFANNEVLLNKDDIDRVKLANIDDAVYFTGDLVPREQTIISSEVDAKVIKVLVDEGQVVKAGQELARLDTLDLAQAVSQQQALLAAAKAQYELDQQKLEKNKELYKQGFISRIAYDELVKNYQSSLENYKAQKSLLNRSKKQLADTSIAAPFSGIIYQKSVEEGQLALKNTKLFALANLEDMEIRAAIPSDIINRVVLGQKVNFKVETDNQIYQGAISRINQVAQSGTRSYMVYVDFVNQKYALKAGQFIKGQIILRSLVNQLIIPCDSIRTNNSQRYVLALDKDNVVKKPINLVLQNQQLNKCAVTGLTANEAVLAGNVLTVKVGDKAKIVD